MAATPGYVISLLLHAARCATHAVGTTAVCNPVVLDQIPVGPKIMASRNPTKQNADLTTVGDSIAAHHVVGVIVANGNSIAAVAVDVVVLGKAKLDTPAPIQPLVVAIQPIVLNQRSLRTGARMDAQICVVVTLAVSHSHVVADLKTDTVAIVVARRNMLNGVSVAVLKEYAAPIISVEVLAACFVAVQCQVFNHDVACVFARQQQKQ